MEKILREVLAGDKSLLCRRDELIAALEAKVPANKTRDFAAIKKALSLNVGEKFFIGGADKDATKAEVAKILKDGGLQEARIKFVTDTFVKALDWDKPLVPVTEKISEFSEPSEANVQSSVQDSKVNPREIPQTETKEISETIEVAQAAKEFAEPTVKVESQKSAKQTPKVQIVKQVPPPVEQAPVHAEQNPPLEQGSQQNPQQNNTQNFQPSRPQVNYETLPQNRKDKIFTTQGRLNRWAFFMKSLKMLVLELIGAALAEHYIGILILIVGVVGNWMLTIRRLHDLNKSGWWALIFFIPYINMVFSLYTIFAPGTRGTNRYGADPLTE